MPAFLDSFRFSFRSPNGFALVGCAAFAAVLASCGSGADEPAASDNPRPAQTITYARALWEIEKEREAAYQKLTAAIASDKLPDLACDRPDSLKVLRGEAREIAVGFCNTAREIVERRKTLTPEEFNQISAELATDVVLQAAIETELLQIREDEAKLSEES